MLPEHDDVAGGRADQTFLEVEAKQGVAEPRAIVWVKELPMPRTKVRETAMSGTSYVYGKIVRKLWRCQEGEDVNLNDHLFLSVCCLLQQQHQQEIWKFLSFKFFIEFMQVSSDASSPSDFHCLHQAGFGGGSVKVRGSFIRCLALSSATVGTEHSLGLVVSTSLTFSDAIGAPVRSCALANLLHVQQLLTAQAGSAFDASCKDGLMHLDGRCAHL